MYRRFGRWVRWLLDLPSPHKLSAHGITEHPPRYSIFGPTGSLITPMETWAHETIPNLYRVRYLWSSKEWVVEFYSAAELVAFTLRWSEEIAEIHRPKPPLTFPNKPRNSGGRKKWV